MKPIKRNYDTLTAICKGLRFIPYTNRLGNAVEGVYTLEGLHAPVDLSACAEDETAILKEAVSQLSQSTDDLYHVGIERDLND